MPKSRYSEDITELKVDMKGLVKSVTQIEEHLKSMNGSIKDCKEHRHTTCPNKHLDVDKRFDKIEHKLAWWSGGLAVIIILFNLLGERVISVILGGG